MLFRFRRLQQEPFINDEQDGGGILGLNLLVGAICTRQIKLQKHIGQAHILCVVCLFERSVTGCFQIAIVRILELDYNSDPFPACRWKYRCTLRPSLRSIGSASPFAANFAKKLH